MTKLLRKLFKKKEPTKRVLSDYEFNLRRQQREIKLNYVLDKINNNETLTLEDYNILNNYGK